MPKYVIERELPGAGSSPRPSCTPSPPSPTRSWPTWQPPGQWQQSYVTADKIYCVYVADDEARAASTPSAAASRPTWSAG